MWTLLRTEIYFLGRSDEIKDIVKGISVILLIHLTLPLLEMEVCFVGNKGERNGPTN